MIKRIKNIQYDVFTIFAALYLIKMLAVQSSLADAIIMLTLVAAASVKHINAVNVKLKYKIFIKSQTPKVSVSAKVMDELKMMKADFAKLTAVKTMTNPTQTRRF